MYSWIRRCTLWGGGGGLCTLDENRSSLGLETAPPPPPPRSSATDSTVHWLCSYLADTLLVVSGKVAEAILRAVHHVLASTLKVAHQLFLGRFFLHLDLLFHYHLHNLEDKNIESTSCDQQAGLHLSIIIIIKSMSA